MALPLIAVALTGLRTLAPTLARSLAGKSGTEILKQGMTKLAEASPLTKLFLGFTGVQAAGGLVKQSQLNAEVRRNAPTNSGW
jgi:hypothetical protein